MSSPAGRPATTALVPAGERELLRSPARRRSVKPASMRWQPPEGLSPAEIRAVIAAAAAKHVEHILNKLGLGTRAQIAAWVAERGLVTTRAD
jgi:hypothetical protein